MTADLATLVTLAAETVQASRDAGHPVDVQVRLAARSVRECWSVHWTEAEARKVGLDARPALVELSGLAEYHWMGRLLAEVVWSTRAKWARDVVETRPVVGSCVAVSQRERETTTGGPVPWLRLTQSIPVWLASDDYARERALHALLAGFVPDNAERPAKLLRVRPDIVAHASTLARYGVDSAREAHAVAHAAAHAVTAYRIEQSGQLVWDAAPRALEHAAALRVQPVLAAEDGEPVPRKRRGKGGAK